MYHGIDLQYIPPCAGLSDYTYLSKGTVISCFTSTTGFKFWLRKKVKSLKTESNLMNILGLQRMTFLFSNVFSVWMSGAKAIYYMATIVRAL